MTTVLTIALRNSGQRVGDVVAVEVHRGDDVVFIRPGEYLLEEGGRVLCIRRAETIDDYLATQLPCPEEV